MTTPRRDPEALLSAYLAVGMEALPDRVVEAVLDEVHRTRQRTVIGPLRTRPVSRATFAAAAVVALLALGAALFVVGRGPSPTPSEEPSPSLPAIVAPSSTPSRPSTAPTASPVTDPAGVWIATGTMGTPRGITCSSDGCSSEHLAVRLLDGRVLVVGGSGHASDPATAELYDPASGTWSATGSMRRPQAGFPPTLLLDGKVLVGDVDDPDPATEDDEIAGAEVYDPASGTWSSAGNSCFGDTATLLRDGKVLGVCQSGPQLYDPDSGTWSATGQMITPRHLNTATLLRDGKVLAAAGYDGGDRPLGSAEVYDPDTGSWTAIANTHFDRRPNCVGCSGGDAWATPLQDGTLLLIRSSGEVEIYDPAIGTWTALAGPTELGRPTALPSAGAVLMTDLRVPNADPQPPCSATALYDPRTGSWTSASSMLRCGHGSSFTLLLDGTVLMAGGSDCSDNVCVSTSAAELYVPHGVSPPPLPAFPAPPPPVFPSPTPRPTPLPPAAGPVPPNARSWKVTVDNQSSEPATLFVAEENEDGTLRLVGSATPNVVPAGATVKVTFLFPADSVPDDGWIYVSSRLETGSLVGAADIGIPGEIGITGDGKVVWSSPP
jgi:Kelch motif